MNEGLWEKLVEGYYERIFSYCCQLLGSKDEALDATQEAFVKAFSSYPKLQDVTKEKAWFYTIARNCCFDRRRWWKRFSLTEVEPSKFYDDELSLEIQQLILKLPLKQREIFVLRHWHGFSTEETAKMLRIHEGTVKSQLKRAVDSLKNQLS